MSALSCPTHKLSGARRKAKKSRGWNEDTCLTYSSRLASAPTTCSRKRRLMEFTRPSTYRPWPAPHPLPGPETPISVLPPPGILRLCPFPALILPLFGPSGPRSPSRSSGHTGHHPHRHTPCRVGCPNRARMIPTSHGNCSKLLRSNRVPLAPQWGH